MKEREIKLMDLIFDILLHWRGIISILLVSGIFLGTVSVIRTSQAARKQADRLQELEEQREQLKEQLTIPTASISLPEAVRRFLVDEEYNLEAVAAGQSDGDISESVEVLKNGLEQKLTETQLNAVNNVLYYEKLCLEKTDYKERSILMQMDSDRYLRAEATFLVTSDDLERTYNFEQVYEDAVLSPDLLEGMAAQAGIDVAYINEIYSLVRGSAGNSNKSDTFKVTIIHYDETMCRTLLQMVIDYVEAVHEETVTIWGTHETTVLSRTIGAVSGMDILDVQNDILADILNLQASIADIKSTFSFSQWYYYNLLTTGEIKGNPYEKPPLKEDAARASLTKTIADVEAAINDEAANTPKVSLTQILGGVVIATFLYVFVIFVIFVLNGKLRGTDHLDELYGIPQLGMIPQEDGGKRSLGFVDKWILSLRYRNQRRFSKDEALGLTATAVKIAAKKHSLDTLYLVGADFKEQALKDCQQIRDILAEGGITVHILGNILYDAEAMEKLNDAQGTVLVEKAGSALYTEIYGELELLKRQSVEVLGGIIME